MEIERIRPHPTADSKPYWDGLRERRLLLQRCADCGTVRHYPRPVCDRCYSMSVDWIEASRRGKVHSWSVSHHAFHPSFKRELPLTFLTVDLDEGVRLCAVLRGGDKQPYIGMPVTVGFEDIDDDLTVPVLHPA